MKTPIDLTALAKKLTELSEGRHDAVTLEQSAKLAEAVNVLGELATNRWREKR